MAEIKFVTEEEKAQFEAFQKEQARKAAQEQKREQRKMLQEMTDEVMGEAMGIMDTLRTQMGDAKRSIIETFSALMELRKEVNTEAGKKEQDSYTFTDSEGTMRIRIGYNMNDGYADSVEEGIAKVKSYIQSLAKDDESQELIDLVLQLLARDQKGNLKASRVIQLSKLAEKSGDEGFQEGIRIIREAYRPTRSKLYIRCQRNRDGEWVEMPNSITEV